MKKTLGRQVVAEFISCTEGILNNRQVLQEIFADGLRQFGLQVNSIDSHQFDPAGVTMVALFGQAHLAIHTYPEARHVSMDIYMSSDNERLLDLVTYFREKLRPATLRMKEILRGNPLEIVQQDWIVVRHPYGFEVRFHIRDRILSKQSRYQRIEIIENESFGKMLFLDNVLQVAESDAYLYNQALVMPLVKADRVWNRKIAILGGGDGGVLHELLTYGPQEACVVDIDKDVVNASREHLRSICKDAFERPNTKLIIDDAAHFLESSQGFDGIILDLTLHPEESRDSKRSGFLIKLLARTHQSLNEGGMLTLQCSSAHDTETQELLKDLLPLYFTNIEFDTVFIPSSCEKRAFGSAVKK